MISQPVRQTTVTTTGATLLPSLDAMAMSKAIPCYRPQRHCLGGIAIAALAKAMLVGRLDVFPLLISLPDF